MCNNKNDFAKGALFGALFGAIAGILTAPASGKETREKIKDTSEKLLEEGKEKYATTRQDLETKATEITEKIRDTVEEIVDETSEKLKRHEDKPKKNKFNGV